MTEDIIGKKFGKLTVVDEVSPIKRKDRNWLRRRFLCKCECGNEIVVLRDSLVQGNTKSCGCLNKQKGRKARRITHGKTNTRLYRIWCKMKSRCNCPNNNRYYCYGARGIKVCDEWNNSFEKFYEWAISHGYAEDLSIERQDNEKGYCPENCIWIPLKEQSKNRRCTK